MAMHQPLTFDGVHGFLDTLFGDDLHAKRVKSLAGATLGGRPARPGSARAADQARRQAGGPAVVHRGIDVDDLLVHWVPYVVGKRDSITVAMDWTEFDADGQPTIMLSLLSRHGRATPLVWLTVDRAALKNRRNGYEYQVLVQPAEILRRCPCAHCGGPGFWRSDILPGADRGTEVRLRRPLSWQHHSRRWRGARRPIGLAPAVAREHCVALRSPPTRIRSPPWSACGRKA